MRPLLTALCALLLASLPAAGQEQVFFPGAEEYRSLASDFASAWYDPALVIDLSGTGSVEMIRPAGICFEADDRLIVVDAATATFHRFDLRDGSYLGKFGREGGFAGEYRDPQAIQKLESGGYAVADAGNHRVQLLDEAFRPLEYFGTLGERDDRSGFARPVAVAARDTRLYVVDRYNQVIKAFGLNSLNPKHLVGYNRLDPSRSVDHPADAAVFGDELAVADCGNDRIVFYSLGKEAPGRYLRALGSTPEEPLRFSGPTALAYDRPGNLWVADAGNRRVLKLSGPAITGTVAVEIAALTGGVALVSPVDLAVNGRAEVAVLDGDLRKVALYRADFFAKGRAAYRERRFAEALDLLGKDLANSLRAGCENPYALFYMAQCHDLSGRYAEAYALYETLTAHFAYGMVRQQALYRMKALAPLLPPPEELPAGDGAATMNRSAGEGRAGTEDER